MCFSAQTTFDLGELQREHDAVIDYEAFSDILEQRLTNSAIKIPKALEANFLEPRNEVEEHIAQLIRQYRAQEVARLEAELFKQKTRLADAQRKLAIKETKAARENERIASKKIQWSLSRLSDLRRETLEEKDSRIFPFSYAAVIALESGRPTIKPMRYHCRQAGKPASYDRKFDGLYNARRDNLTRFWRGQYGHDHAIIVMDSFYENVARHDYEQRALKEGESAENLVLQFSPQPRTRMVVACLWSRWEELGKPALNSFAAITDEPPPEISATGHDRCVITLNPQRVLEWLTPKGRSLSELDGILDDRPMLVHRHALAA